MVAALRLLAILWPLAEILVLVVVADEIGIGWTFLALLGAGLAGIAVIRVLGAASLVELQGALARREPPTGALVRGACVLLAGMLLIVPGFLSDVVALLLLIPPLRTGVLGAVWRRWPRGGGGGSGPVIIEGDYRAVPPEGATPLPPSPLPPTPSPDKLQPPS
jgi:UPF0716 protein FxsA